MENNNNEVLKNNSIFLKILGEILCNPEFGRSVLPSIYPHQFGHEDFQKLVAIIKDYHTEYDNIPNIDGLEFIIANKYSKPTDVLPLTQIVKSLKALKVAYAKNFVNDDSKFVRDTFVQTLRIGELEKLAREVIPSIINETKKKSDVNVLTKVKDEIENVFRIGDTSSRLVDLFDNIDDAISDEFREPIPTNIGLDKYIDGGLASGEMGIVLAGSGVGKSTLLSLIGCNAALDGRNVIHFYFEGKTSKRKEMMSADVKRKYYAKVLGISLTDIKEMPKDELKQRLISAKEKNGMGVVKIEKFEGDNITINVIKSYIRKYEKELNITFDLLILDYIDNINPQFRTGSVWDGEVEVVRSLERMISELNIACWTATQGKKESDSNSDEKRFLFASDAGGSVEKHRKSTVYLSIAKNTAQKANSTAHCVLLKSRVSADGVKFSDIPFDNNKMLVDFSDSNANSFKVNGDSDFSSLINK